MLVIISDLHLTDGTSGETIKSGAFKTFQERLRDLAYDASWRSDDEYRPLEGIDLVLLGDILDVIRSTRWFNAPSDVRPWGRQDDPRFSEMVTQITKEIIANNKDSLAALKSLHDPIAMNIPPATPEGRVALVSRDLNARERVSVPVRIHYLVGNHDWFYHLEGAAFDEIRKLIVEARGLENSASAPFPHDPAESPLLQKLYREHSVFARHGDIFDSSNFEQNRDASSMGDAIVIELLDRFGVEVRNRLRGQLPDECESGLKEIDNVRPLSIIPIWVDGLISRTCTPELAHEIKQIWNEVVYQFLAIDFVRSRPFASSALLKLGFEISSEVPLAGLSDVAAWFTAKFGGHAASFYPYALHEAAFTQEWVKFIVYGHTHHYEIVPLQSLQQGNRSVDQIYINSGTWRPVHELAQFHPGQKHFVGYHVMTFLSFFKNNERKGRAFESWSGALDSSAD
jgi:UDP-2,3-diacylglucosamine pyrophosphatase LpxH